MTAPIALTDTNIGFLRPYAAWLANAGFDAHAADDDDAYGRCVNALVLRFGEAFRTNAERVVDAIQQLPPMPIAGQTWRNRIAGLAVVTAVSVAEGIAVRCDDFEVEVSWWSFADFAENWTLEFDLADQWPVDG